MLLSSTIPSHLSIPDKERYIKDCIETFFSLFFIRKLPRLLKEHIRLGHATIVDLSVSFIDTR